MAEGTSSLLVGWLPPDFGYSLLIVSLHRLSLQLNLAISTKFDVRFSAPGFLDVS